MSTRIQCERHGGRQPTRFVCVHTTDGLASTAIGATGVTAMLCAACATRNAALAGDAELEAFWDELTLVCARCFEESR